MTKDDNDDDEYEYDDEDFDDDDDDDDDYEAMKGLVVGNAASRRASRPHQPGLCNPRVLGVASESYTPGHQYWESISLLKRTCFLVGVKTLVGVPIIQRAFITLFIVMCMVADLHAQPYVDARANIFAFFLSAAAFLMSLLVNQDSTDTLSIVYSTVLSLLSVAGLLLMLGSLYCRCVLRIGRRNTLRPSAARHLAVRLSAAAAAAAASSYKKDGDTKDGGDGGGSASQQQQQQQQAGGFEMGVLRQRVLKAQAYPEGSCPTPTEHEEEDEGGAAASDAAAIRSAGTPLDRPTPQPAVQHTPASTSASASTPTASLPPLKLAPRQPAPLVARPATTAVV